jgi:F-type H+-transporting ATPase subunit b
MMDFLQDAHAWVAISFVIFAVGGYVFGRKAVAAKLDGRIAAIRRDIDTAAALRAEAQALLSTFENKQREAAREVESMISHARQQADSIRRQAASDLEDAVRRREQQMADRLRRMEENTVADIRAYAADLAVKATAEIIADKMDEEVNAHLVEQSVKKIAGQLG